MSIDKKDEAKVDESNKNTEDKDPENETTTPEGDISEVSAKSLKDESLTNDSFPGDSLPGDTILSEKSSAPENSTISGAEEAIGTHNDSEVPLAVLVTDSAASSSPLEKPHSSTQAIDLEVHNLTIDQAPDQKISDDDSVNPSKPSKDQTGIGNSDSKEAETIFYGEDDPKDENEWLDKLFRLLFMVLFGFTAWCSLILVFTVSALNFAVTIIQNKPNPSLSKFCMLLGIYIKDIVHYLSYTSDTLPFPLGKDFPSAEK